VDKPLPPTLPPTHFVLRWTSRRIDDQ
jgi:hypothetical protein